jgi:DNA-binding NarL/FixJ family response regulator
VQKPIGSIRADQRRINSLCNTKAAESSWRLKKMNPLPAILVYDRDTSFREALRNFLLAAGYPQVEVAATIRAALIKLRHEHYGYILIEVSHSLSEGRRLAAVAQRRQPEAKIVFLVGAKDQPFIKDVSFETVIKEYVYSNLLELM